MRSNSKGLLVSTLCVILVLLAAIIVTTTESEAAISPTSADAVAMRAVIERSYELRALAAHNFDISQFSSVYTNEGSRLTADQLALVRKVFPNSGDNAGWLDFTNAYYADWQLGAQNLALLQARAKAQGRDLTAEDFRSVKGSVGPPARTDPIHKSAIRYDSFKMTGNRGTVILDDGAALQRVILIKTMDGWRITGTVLINVHF